MPDLGLMYRNQLARQLIDQPHVFITEEALDFSRHLVFAIQNGNGEVTVFPGGLTRVSDSSGRITNNSSGGACKPTWVVR